MRLHSLLYYTYDKIRRTLLRRNQQSFLAYYVVGIHYLQYITLFLASYGAYHKKQQINQLFASAWEFNWINPNQPESTRT